MTGFLASVSSVAEARLACSLGADIIDLKNPHQGALGALDTDTVQSVVYAIGSDSLLSATIGDLSLRTDAWEQAVNEMRQTGVDIVKVGVFDDDLPAAALQSLQQIAARNCHIVLVFFAEHYGAHPDFAMLKETGIKGVMLDTCEKVNGRLTDKLDAAVLNSFVTDAGQAGLITGLAGSLSAADIPPLLRLAPDYLGFRGALCDHAQRNQVIDPARVRKIRDLIPCNASNSVAI